MGMSASHRRIFDVPIRNIIIPFVILFCFVPFKSRPRQNDLVLNESEDGLGYSAAASIQLLHNNNIIYYILISMYIPYNMHCVAGVRLKSTDKLHSFLTEIQFFYHKPIMSYVIKI